MGPGSTTTPFIGRRSGETLRRTLRLLAAVGFAQLIVGTGAAMAANPWVGPDPAKNYPLGQLPSACFSKPTSATCINAGVYYLDRARAALKIGPYKLPANFAALTPTQQTLILTNLDRIHYKLPPVAGVTAGLSGDALAGVKGDTDPHPTVPGVLQWTANWAGGYQNIVLAYEGWMYNDGYKSPNGGCTTPAASECWGHRHDILWKFSVTGPLAAGVAAGKDPHGSTGFAMLLGQGTAGWKPGKYLYTWAQAVKDGAGKHNYVVHAP